MLNEQMLATILRAQSAIEHDLRDVIEEMTYELDGEGIAEALLGDDVLPKNKQGVTYHEALNYFIGLCSYVEERTNVPAIIDDTLYDKLVAKTIELGGRQPIGAPSSNVIGIDERSHKFPELRGSLAKVHFLYDKEVPEKDSRGSLEHYLNSVVRQMKATGLPIGETPISVDVKRDGVSHVIEGEGLSFKHILTRGDVDNNRGKDLTPLFKQFYPDAETDGIDVDMMVGCMNLNLIPADIWDYGNEFGIKVETYMKTDAYESFKKSFDIKRCNRRSAVVSICNQAPMRDFDKKEEPNPWEKYSKYLNMDHFQIACTKPIKLDEYSLETIMWYPIGKINGHYNYLYVEQPDTIDLRDIPACIEKINAAIGAVKREVGITKVPCDGAVITFLDPKIIELLGRKSDKNMFQVAFKFPAGEEKTIVESIDFQVGPIAGRITPMARLKPIRINGNRISNVTISNADKLKRLNLHVGDEVLIRYDIVPTIFKPEGCKEVDGEPVAFPTECPICHGEVVNECCSNDDCPAKAVGHIMNFIEKRGIKGGIGLETVVLLVDRGYLKSIGDLYRLRQYRMELCSLPKLGETSVASILDGIEESRKMFPHQILGAIGIPNIGLKTMEKICKRVNVLGNIDRLDELTHFMLAIPGIGEKTVPMVIDGIAKKRALIEDICKNVDIVGYDTEKQYDTTIYITSVKDKAAFKEYLESINVKVADSFTKSTDVLVIPDEPTEKPLPKAVKAEKWGIPVITLSEAKERWGYDN
ncbi:MAG: hypothetical protein NC548_40195 [Lachnospiraceae bacterium]|nr:hypothetical protein [Lachnospiraceae bacterium]